MAIHRSQTLIRNYSSRLFKSSTNSINFSRSRSGDSRDSYCCFSTIPDFSMLPDASGDSTPCSPSEALAVRLIEDAVHRVIVSRSAPDWLPLVPGASYWVPPKRRNYGVAQLLRSLSNAHLHDVDHELLMSLITSRGWPSSDYYLPDGNDSSSEQTEAEVTSSDSSISDDQEG